MGKIQRKKTSRKKKKQKENLPAAVTADGDAADRVVPAPAVSSEEPAKRQPLPQKRPMPAAKTTPIKPKRGYWDKGLQFLREVKIELKKVTWPSRKQTIGSTAVVIVLVMIISLFLGIVDVGLSSLVRVVLQ